jgi:hypothetical protein
MKVDVCLLFNDSTCWPAHCFATIVVKGLSKAASTQMVLSASCSVHACAVLHHDVTQPVYIPRSLDASHNAIAQVSACGSAAAAAAAAATITAAAAAAAAACATDRII